MVISWSLMTLAGLFFHRQKWDFHPWQWLFVSELQNTNVLTCCRADPYNITATVYPIFLLPNETEKWNSCQGLDGSQGDTLHSSTQKDIGALLAVCSWALPGKTAFHVGDALSCTRSTLCALLCSPVILMSSFSPLFHSDEHCGEQ